MLGGYTDPVINIKRNNKGNIAQTQKNVIQDSFANAALATSRSEEPNYLVFVSSYKPCMNKINKIELNMKNTHSYKRFYNLHYMGSSMLLYTTPETLIRLFRCPD